MTAPDILAGRLLQIADRLEADMTFGGSLAARDLREAAELIHPAAIGTSVDVRRATGRAIQETLANRPVLREGWP